MEPTQAILLMRRAVAHLANNIIELPSALDVNRVLSALDAISRSMVVPHLQLVHLKTGGIICHAGEKLLNTYFPVTAGISLQYVAGDIRTLSTAEIGHEGVVCDDVIGGATQRRVIVYRGGFAYRMSGRRFADVAEASAAFRRQIFLCMQMILAQASRVMLCSRHHAVRHQLCRWLLIAHERSRSIEIPVTHGILAQMLGVRRETVSEMTRQLQELRLISQHRGTIVLTDVVGLDRQGCDCHRAIRDESRRILAVDENRTPMGSHGPV
ncbi:Crp/Fnr family transcriptional regulator [Burkholderia ambifaria]|uniref:Crp/Fnr family transcriptional regulator n=1 Tax=Burkholderia ambifaria TaxID=152480 RepID=UPI001E517C76|nr:Crp/Fnr family transcriptional regulator [Burkholderia ambifaria]UEP23092.1 Crp/Fnr family transcriptional regulator [Burkholderia ambifaria]UEP39836.1 Crp/Fnr family transcriptional regulator [Burkholderia ambifaria]